jgi:hypothetical protein
MIPRYVRWCEERVSGASLSLFRVVLGAFLVADAVYYLTTAQEIFPSGPVRLRYAGWEGWPRLTLAQNHGVLVLLGLAGAALAVGFRSRAAAGVAFLCVLHVIVNDSSFYLNHMALVLLLLGVALFVPMDRRYALRPSAGGTVARYELGVVVATLWASYVLGGVAKLRPDWLNGDLLAANLISRQDASVIARWFVEAGLEPWLAWGVVVLELLAPAGLALRRLRLATAVSLAAFHVLSHHMLNIGLFSYLMIAALVLYFDPAWPDRALARLRDGAPAPPAPARAADPRVVWAAALWLACLLALVARPYLLVPRGSRWAGEADFLAFRGAGLSRGRDCQARFNGARATGLTDWQEIRLQKYPSLAWSLARERLCAGGQGSVHVDYRCIAPGLAGEVPGIDPKADLCREPYRLAAHQAWILETPGRGRGP